jgi:hypothetical protein
MDYDFGNKRHYRRNIYAFVDRHCDKTVKERKVLYIDTKEGGETLFLLNKGYRPENLYVANTNPGEVAQLTKNLKKDFGVRVNTFGIEMGDALARLGDKGVYIDVYNFDYTCNVSSPTVEQDLYILAAHVLIDKHIVCVNVLRGREKNFFKKYKHWNMKNDVIRSNTIKSNITGLIKEDYMPDIKTKEVFHITADNKYPAVNMYCYSHILRQARGIYRSTAGNQTMMWTALKVQKHCEVSVEDMIDILSDKEAGDHPWCNYSKYGRGSEKEATDKLFGNAINKVVGNENNSYRY